MNCVTPNCLLMSNILEAREKVCNIIYDFLTKLYMRGVNRDRDLQFAMAILCMAKGKCTVLNRVVDELRIYDLKEFDINNLVAEIRAICEEKVDDILPACADIIMDKYTNGPWGEYLQPRELTNLVLTLMRARSCKVVYNPFAGLASYAIADFIEKYYAQDINFVTSNIAKMRLELNNINYSNYENSDSIKKWNDHGADCIVSTPPFGLRLPSDTVRSAGTNTCEEFWLRKFISGKSDYAFFVITRGNCNIPNGPLYNVRRDISEKNLLEMVINLPSGLFSNSSVSTSLVVLSKKRSEDHPIVFVDAEKMFSPANRHSKILDVSSVLKAINNKNDENHISLTLQSLKDNSYIWNAGFYKAERNLNVPKGYDVVRFEEITSIIKGHRRFNEKQGRLVMISNLSSDVTNCILDREAVDISEDLSNATKLEEPALLLSSIRDLKPTLCMASPEEPLFIHPHIWAYKIGAKWVNPKYLCMELSKANHIVLGASVPRLSRAQLDKTKLVFPSKDSTSSAKEQEQLYDSFVQATKLSKAKEMGLQEVIDKMKAEYINVIRTRKHDMRAYVRESDSAELLMRHYLSKKDEMKDFEEKMNGVLDQYHLALSKLSELIEVFSEEEKFGKHEAFNIDKYFYEMEKNQDVRLTNYFIRYYCDDNALQDYGLPYHKNFNRVLTVEDWKSYNEDLIKGIKTVPLIVDIAPLDFDRLIRNIIENARTHGFTDQNRINYQIGINLTVIPEKEMFQIDIINNGTPLPKGMDKERYGLLGEKAGITGGTGRGGYIVKSIVEHYHGDYDVFMENENTVIRILLPISNQYGK